MELYETKSGRLGLRDVPPVPAEWLRQITSQEGFESEDVEERLFPSPSLEAGEEELREDWKAFVQPELHELFQSARQVVEADLRGLKEGEDDFFSLEFPLRHAESWLNALNQARLALAARHGFSEGELSQKEPAHIATERDLARIQIEFYGYLQHWLVEVLS
jgi:hypothetical protein